MIIGHKKCYGLFVLLMLLASYLSILYFVPTVKGNPTYEDFTGYTEKDGTTLHINKTANHIDFNAFRNEDAWLYKDKTANHFGTSFTHLIDVKASTGGTGTAVVWALSNYVDDLSYWGDNSKSYYAVYFYGAYVRLYLEEKNGASAIQQVYVTLSFGTQYYLKMVKSGTSLTLYVYSDAARTTQVTGSPKSLTVTDNSFQYIFASDTYNIGTTAATNTDIDNLDLQEVAGYALNLRVMDWDLADAISGATVYKDTDTKLSNGGGWANWTGVSGTVAIKVKYYGFWVNGTFSVTMDADKTIDVKCKLYDVTVTAKPNNEIGVISGTNVTAYNNTGNSNGKIKSGITVDTTGQVTLTNVPNATLRFIMYAKSDYSIIIANTTQLISSDDYSFNIVANQNYATATLSFGYEAIIWMSSLSALPLLTVTSFMVRKKLKKLRNGGEKACMQEKHV